MDEREIVVLLTAFALVSTEIREWYKIIKKDSSEKTDESKTNK